MSGQGDTASSLSFSLLSSLSHFDFETGSHQVAKVGLEPVNPPALVSQVAGIVDLHIRPGCKTSSHSYIEAAERWLSG